MSTADLFAIIGSMFGTTLGVALALGVMTMRITARIDADRRTFQAEAAQDRRALQASMDRHQASMDRFQAGMDTFRAEMQRLAERQSRVEGTQEVRSLNPGGAG